MCNHDFRVGEKAYFYTLSVKLYLTLGFMIIQCHKPLKLVYTNYLNSFTAHNRIINISAVIKILGFFKKKKTNEEVFAAVD